MCKYKLVQLPDHNYDLWAPELNSRPSCIIAPYVEKEMLDKLKSASDVAEELLMFL